MAKNLYRGILNRFLHLIARFAPGATNLRPAIHRLRGVKIYGKAWIGDDVYLDNEYPEHIEIHNGAGIGMRSLLVAHTRGPGRIIIEEDAYIGPGSIVVCPAGRTIRIGKGSSIGPGCVVSSSVPEFVFIVAPKCKKAARVTTPFIKAATVDEFVAGLLPYASASKKKRNYHPKEG